MTTVRPNILVFFTDQQRYDSLGCHGNRVARTPHIDGLAAGGARLDNHIVANPVCMPSRASPDSYGVWAPDISFYDGKFWVVVPIYHGRPKCTNYRFVADHADGPYGDPVLLNQHIIDPSISNDDNGRRYLLFGGGWVHELAKDGSQLLGQPRQVWPGTGGRTPERPHLLKRDGWYYLLLAEWGTSFGHMCTGGEKPFGVEIVRAVSAQSDLDPARSAGSNPEGGVTESSSTTGTGTGGCFTWADGRWPPAVTARWAGRRSWSGWNGQRTAGRWSGAGGVPEDDVPVPGASQRDRSYSVIDVFGAGPLDHGWEWVRRPIDDGAQSGPYGLTIRCLPYDPCAYQPTQMLTKPWERDGFTMTVKTTAGRGVSTSA